uniref:High affinity nitrate transporter 2.6 n=1 Tax=Anthurium amnicola TaxID=1678845 RepID=A0A1D1XS10_9ARAE
MKFVLIYVIVLLALLANEVLSKPIKGGQEDICKGLTPTNGKQIPEGSCSTTIQGIIPSSDKMTSSFIISPENESVLIPNTAFNVEVVINNLATGAFSDPKNQYYTEPQTVDGSGIVKGHSHVTIQKIDGLNPPNAKNFEFFEGLNQKAAAGHLVTKVIDKNGKPGLPAGKYRICAMSSSFTHQPLLMPIAKRGAQDDCIRITVGTIIINDNLDGKKKEKGGKGGKKEH